MSEWTTIIDYGGQIGPHIAQGKLYAALGTKLKVLFCASACLLMLAQVPKENICVMRAAWIGNHSADWNGGPQPASAMVWERGADWIARGYRECSA